MAPMRHARKSDTHPGPIPLTAIACATLAMRNSEEVGSVSRSEALSGQRETYSSSADVEHVTLTDDCPDWRQTRIIEDWAWVACCADRR